MPKSKKRKLKSRKIEKIKLPYAIPMKKVEGSDERFTGYSIKLRKPKAIGSLITVLKITNWDYREKLIDQSEELLQTKLEDMSTVKDLLASEIKDEVLIKQVQESIEKTTVELTKVNLQLRGSKLRTKKVKMRVTKYMYTPEQKYLTMLQDVV